MLARIGRWTFTHHWATVGIWILALFAVFGISGAVGDASSSQMSIPSSESGDGFEILKQSFPNGGGGGAAGGTIVFDAPQGVTDPSVQSQMEAYFADVAKIDGVKGVESPYGPAGARQIATVGDKAGKLAYASIGLDANADQAKMTEVGKQLREKAPTISGGQVLVGGNAFSEFEAPNSELIGLAFAVVILILAFGSVLAMGLPIGVAIAGVGGGSAVVVVLSHVFTIPEFAPIIGTMIGLGVGIDYALFIVTRYREGLHNGLSPLDATGRAMDTAGRAVLFAGLTVVISLLGMLLIGLPFVSGLGISAATTVLITMLSSMTLLPALLGFAKERVEITRWRGLIAAGLIAVAMLGAGLKFTALTVALPLAVVVIIAGFFVGPLKKQVPPRRQKPVRETTAYRWSRLIQAHPWAAVVGGLVVLLVLAAPALKLHLGFSDEGNAPVGSQTRQAYDQLAQGFGPGFNGPFVVVTKLNSPSDLASLQKLSQAIGSAPGIAQASPAVPNDPTNPTAAIIQVIPTTAPQDVATEDTVANLRSTVVPQAVDGTGLQPKLTGTVPIGIDFSSYLAGRTLAFFGVVLTLSFILLMAVFRSLLVPLKAVVMNMLSLAAAYGIVVALFQWGWGEPFLKVGGAPIEPFIPMMLFAIVFGLSMDYEVFLLSRVKEEYDKTGDAQTSVADGLAATARVITAAAAIMVVVFGSFLLEDNRTFKLFGLGLAVAVLIDATLVRMLLVPATMELLGDRNWWIPRWLERILPNISVEGHDDDVDIIDVSSTDDLDDKGELVASS